MLNVFEKLNEKLIDYELYYDYIEPIKNGWNFFLNKNSVYTEYLCSSLLYSCKKISHIYIIIIIIWYNVNLDL